jgi:hypothetical protein
VLRQTPASSAARSSRGGRRNTVLANAEENTTMNFSARLDPMAKEIAAYVGKNIRCDLRSKCIAPTFVLAAGSTLKE